MGFAREFRDECAQVRGEQTERVEDEEGDVGCEEG